MRLIMPSPIKHPSSGIFYLRVRVPAEAQRSLGKTEVKKSLGTRDPVLAKVKFAEEYSALCRTFEYHRELSCEGTQATLTMKDCQILADRWFSDEMSRVESEDDYQHWAVRTGREGQWENVSAVEDPGDLLDDGAWSSSSTRERCLQLVGEPLSV